MFQWGLYALRHTHTHKHASERMPWSMYFQLNHWCSSGKDLNTWLAAVPRYFYEVHVQQIVVSLAYWNFRILIIHSHDALGTKDIHQSRNDFCIFPESSVMELDILHKYTWITVWGLSL